MVLYLLFSNMIHNNSLLYYSIVPIILYYDSQ